VTAAEPLATIADAFSATAAAYDAFATDHPHLTRIRHQVYESFERFVPPGASVLELNAGTGTDAVHLAGRGYRVHATDISPGMLDRLRSKVSAGGLQNAVTVQQCSFLELDAVSGGPYVAVLSNLGGLNCTADLGRVAAGLQRLLAPGGVAVLVVMPRICLWELALVFTGQFRLATRRLRRGGTIAHLEGRHFPVYYFDPQQVVHAFASGYDVISIQGLSVLTPTLESKNLAIRHPRVYGTLAWLDDRVAAHRPFSAWGDFAIVALRRRSAS
jgi:ubiquinone/menaquinone biosynthesis C-methylase UbiE